MNLLLLILFPLITALAVLAARNPSQVRWIAFLGSAAQLGLSLFLYYCYNQARVHGGYHYPRSFMTAIRSLINYPKFLHDFKQAIVDDIEHIYAIARYGSKTNARQFFNIYKKFGAPIKKSPSSITEKFDLNGNLLQNIHYNENGSIDYITYYAYNANNKQTEVRRYDSKGYSNGKETSKYDAQGNKTEHITYNPDKSVDAFTYQNNVRRKGQKRVQYYPETATDLTNEKSSSYNQYLDGRPRDGSIVLKRLYRYDKHAKLLEESFFDTNGAQESHILYSYDLYGNCSGYVEYDATNKPMYKSEFVYSK